MPTLCSNIYKRAINSFDDPFIKSTYGNTINFFKIMFGYLNNAIPEFIIPEIVIEKLEDMTLPSGATEMFDGDGIINNFTLTTTPPLGSYFIYMINENQVSGSFNYITNQVTLVDIPPTGTDNVSIEWYFEGQFNQTLNTREERILTLLWVQNWAEKEKNHLLDIRRLLNDTDFKLNSEAPNINAKGNWYIGLREEATSMMKSYSWSLFQKDLKQKYGLS